MVKIVPSGDQWEDMQVTARMVNQLLAESGATAETMSAYQDAFVEAVNSDNNTKLFHALAGQAEMVLAHKEKNQLNLEALCKDMKVPVPAQQPTKQERLEAYFGALIYLLGTSNKLETLSENAKMLTKILTDMGGSEFQLMRLRHLQMCYNTVPKNVKTTEICKYMLYAILHFARDNALFLEMVPYLTDLESWVKAIFSGANAEEEAGMLKEIYYIVASELVKVCKGDPLITKVAVDMPFEWLKKYLEAETEVTEDSAKMVEHLVEQICNLPNVYQVESVLKLPVIGKARSVARVEKLMQLVDLFVDGMGSIEKYNKLVAADKALLETTAIDLNTLRAKMQVLTLAEICDARKEIPLAEVEKKLDVASVEDIVGAAVKNGVVNCRIDECTKTLAIYSVYQRNFKDEQWAELEGVLDKWIAKVKNLQAVTNRRSAAALSGA